MNNKGQYLIFGYMMFLMAAILVLALSSPLKTITDQARDIDHLQCDYSNQSAGVYLSCITVDLILPYFLVTVLVVGGSYMFYKQAIE